MTVAQLVALLIAFGLLAYVLWPLLPARRAPGVADGACPDCGHALEPGAQFCSSCGRPLRD